MAIAFISISLIMGFFMSYIWSSNGFKNTLIKVGFSLYTLFAAALLLGILVPMVATSGMRLF